jgi:hypothetical protein
MKTTDTGYSNANENPPSDSQRPHIHERLCPDEKMSIMKIHNGQQRGKAYLK